MLVEYMNWCWAKGSSLVMLTFSCLNLELGEVRTKHTNYLGTRTEVGTHKTLWILLIVMVS